MSVDVGIDLGTTSILVYIRGRGVVVKEPSVVAFDRSVNKITAIGEEARQMLGRTPGNIVAIRPVKEGVISNFTLTAELLKYFINKAIGRKTWRKPRVCISVPTLATEVEKRAVEDAAIRAGAREVFTIEEPIASAIGVGIDVSKPVGNLIVDVGGGTTDVAVISLNGAVESTSIKTAGEDFDKELAYYIRKEHNLLIGQNTAEQIKMKIGSLFKRDEVAIMEVSGRDLMSGLPRMVEVSSDETRMCFEDLSEQVIQAIQTTLERTPPELAADIAYRGIVLSGGGSLIDGFDDMIEARTGISVVRAEEPMTAVAVGTGQYMERIK
ncbi:MAG: rod shape-determining protein [Eubacteriales bacterium]|nr:rod shape-determining protein [Eubacteriales bacterium]